MIKKMPATLSTPCDIIGQKAAFFEFFRLASKLAMSKKSSKIKGFRDRKKYFCEYLTHSDDLGRVVIPKEIRRTLRIRESDPLEIFTDREGEIILKKYSPIGELGTFSREYAEALAQAAGCLVCITDRDQVIGASGSGSKEYMENRINRDLEDMISDRKNVRITEGNYVRILEEDKSEYGSQVIYTITCAGDAVGAVVILGKPGDRKFSETEEKLAQVAAGFLGRQMEQ